MNRIAAGAIAACVVACLAVCAAACSGGSGAGDAATDAIAGEGCEAMPDGNAQCTMAGLPRFFLCRIPFTPPPSCVRVLIGDTIEGYCCP